MAIKANVVFDNSIEKSVILKCISFVLLKIIKGKIEKEGMDIEKAFLNTDLKELIIKKSKIQIFKGKWIKEILLESFEITDSLVNCKN